MKEEYTTWVDKSIWAYLPDPLIFNKEIYDQRDSTLMDCPVAPILASLFMDYHENDWIENAQVAKPTFYKKHVDDIFAVLESELDAETFCTCLNIKHKIIKFR